MLGSIATKSLIGVASTGIVITGVVLISPKNKRQEFQLEGIGRELNELQNTIFSECGNYANVYNDQEKLKVYNECESREKTKWQKNNKEVLERHQESLNKKTN